MSPGLETSGQTLWGLQGFIPCVPSGNRWPLMEMEKESVSTWPFPILCKGVICWLFRVGMGSRPRVGAGSAAPCQGPLLPVCFPQGQGHGRHSPHQEGVPLLVDNDGFHIRKHGAFLILHHQVVLPQGHAVGQGVAEQRQGAGSAWLPALASQWGREGTQGFGDPALWPPWESFVAGGGEGSVSLL